MRVDEATDSRSTAGFWRRIGAFLVDGLLLGVIGQTLGFFLTRELVALGAWGRLLGFLVALTYFGLLNSKLANGQTLGKRLLKIRVVGSDGTPLSVARSVVRFLPLGAAWFLNGIMLPTSSLMSIWAYVFSIAVFGVGLSIAYLFVFNHRTRQSAHDLLVNSYVVMVSAQTVRPDTGVWKVHLLICGGLIAASCLAPYFLSGLANQAPFQPLMKIYEAAVAEPWVVHATVNKGKGIVVSSKTGRNETSYVNMTAYLNTPDIENAEHAKELALLTLKSDSSVGAVDLIRVTLAYGYDIGIASSWRAQTYSHSPAEWSARSETTSQAKQAGIGPTAACAVGWHSTPNHHDEQRRHGEVEVEVRLDAPCADRKNCRRPGKSVLCAKSSTASG